VHLLRTTQQIQYQLSQMADQKASMLLGITFVIFTIAVGQARGPGGAPLPLLILGAAAFLAATLTVMAVLPAVKGPPRAAAFSGGNILFFGAFTQLDEDEFVDTLLGRLGDAPAVYELFAHDIYQNGRVLARKKYRLLGWAYRVLLVGLFASFAAFLVPILAHLAKL
jgi:hypothetical protein